MFTGLVQDKARVAAIERNGGGVRLTVETRVEPIARGDSVSHQRRLPDGGRDGRWPLHAPT